MKASTLLNPAGLPTSVSIPETMRRQRFSRRSGGLAAFLTPLLVMGLSGCLSLTIRTKKVTKIVQPPQVMDCTLEDLNDRLDKQYAAVQSLNARVNIKVTSGGESTGEIKELPTFAGYMLLRKPSDLRVILQVPLVGSLALDTVSDGKNFKLSVPSYKIAREGSEQVTTPSKKGFENLRPNIIREALLVPAVRPDEVVNLVQGSRIVPAGKGQKDPIKEPDCDLTVSRHKSGNENETVRVIHIGRVTLKPYEQDIYDPDGRLVTVVTYDNYQKSGDIDFPTSIMITRPIDEYSLKIDITKLTLNQPMDDEQFVLKFPDNIPVQKMP